MKCKCGKEAEGYRIICDECMLKIRDEEREQRITNKIKSAIPKKFLDIDTDREIGDYYKKSLFICGLVGAGKSVFMASIAKRLIRDKEQVRWVSFPEMSMRLKGSFKNDDEDVYSIVKEVATFKDWLMIDDMKAEAETGIVKEAIYYIINHREMEMLPTIITSNISLSGWEKRIASRIKGMCEIVNLKGNDRRMK